jgi:hypothetical protein
MLKPYYVVCKSRVEFDNFVDQQRGKGQPVDHLRQAQPNEIFRLSRSDLCVISWPAQWSARHQAYLRQKLDRDELSLSRPRLISYFKPGESKFDPELDERLMRWAKENLKSDDND